MKLTMGILIATLGLQLGAGAAHGQAVTAVPHLDMDKFYGTWHEVALLPNKREKNCVSDPMVLMTTGQRKLRFDVVDSCVTKDTFGNVRNLTGKIDKAGDGALKIGPSWPFYAKYWVLALADDDSWALVGSPNHKTLWILSRKPTLAEDVLAQIKSRAAAEGFDVTKLVTAKQTR